MKSPMVEQADYIKQKSDYSELQVLQSAAGYYVGTLYTDPDDGFQEPGSRDSDYFGTHEAAEKYLAAIKGNERIAQAGLMTRMTP